MLLAQLLLGEVFRRVLVPLDDGNDGFLVVAFPIAVNIPLVSVHHHDGKVETTILAVERVDFGRKVFLSIEGKREGAGNEENY